jgi:hypothetical protein
MKVTIEELYRQAEKGDVDAKLQDIITTTKMEG